MDVMGFNLLGGSTISSFDRDLETVSNGSLSIAPETETVPLIVPNATISGGVATPELELSFTPGTDDNNVEMLENFILGNEGIIEGDNLNGDVLTGEIATPNLGIPDLDIVFPPPFLGASTDDQLWSQDTPNIDGVPEAEDKFGWVVATGDFNGDGYDDLAVGEPHESIEGQNGAGAVNIIYGSVSGLNTTNNRTWHQNSSDSNNQNIQSSAEADDHFGSSLAVGDFNNDGYDDLAVGVPGEDVGNIQDAGAVNLIYGSASGLTAANNRIFHQDTFDVGGISELNDLFGASLTSGDFDGDGYDDLAIGVPGEDLQANGGNIIDAGAVNVLYGSFNRLTATNDQFLHQNTVNVPSPAEAGDRFGASLASGDFDGNGYDDLAVGVPGEDLGNIIEAGAVNILNGSANRLSGNGSQIWHQDRVQNGVAIQDQAEFRDRFGWSLAAGDFDGNGYDDLAIGGRTEDIDTVTTEPSSAVPPFSQGAVNVIYGSVSSLTALNNQYWHQDIPGVGGIAEHGDGFGSSLNGQALTAGDFDGDGYEDLAIGVPGESIGTIQNAGAVNILRGSSQRLTEKNDRLISQNTLDLEEEPAEADDAFGSSLAAGDFNGDGYADIAVGVPGEDIRDILDAGAVNVFYDV